MSRTPMKLTFLHGGVNQGPVAEVDQPEEESVVHRPGQGGDGVETVVSVLALVDPLGSDLDLWTDEVAVEELPVLNSGQRGDFLTRQRVVHLAGLLATLLL